MKNRERGIRGRARRRREASPAAAEVRRERAEREREAAEVGRARAETLRTLAEQTRQSAEDARKSAEEARHAAEDARRHRDAVLHAIEAQRRRSEQGRAAAEAVRRAEADQFDTRTRRAIREEVEVAAEMQRTTNELDRRGPEKRQAIEAEKPSGTSIGRGRRR